MHVSSAIAQNKVIVMLVIDIWIVGILTTGSNRYGLRPFIPIYILSSSNINFSLDSEMSKTPMSYTLYLRYDLAGNCFHAHVVNMIPSADLPV